MYAIDNPDEFRANIVKKLIEIVDNERLGKNLEIGVYNYAIKDSTSRAVVKKWENPYFTQLYIDRLRSIYLNLTKLDGLREQLKNNSLKVDEFAFMTHQEMDPDNWKELIEIKKKRDESKYTNTIKISSDFTCSRCKKNGDPADQCTYYQLQTRSADEPMTTFVTCLNCGKRWKF
ncbi:MAG: hypothetical protein CMF80_06035 [Candidatus Marinimicrobia bacterium]|nr:hypothetical protein [Candidatus Neomarinimicrobiota bacterium]|tara:strand:- start:2183 stop:2707 length:525 start_codon:yes stop_codon:yes gene_type:complete